jgi:hypothetical protein
VSGAAIHAIGLEFPSAALVIVPVSRDLESMR